MHIETCLVLCALAAWQTISYRAASPVWLTSDYFRAGNQPVINRLTGNNETPTYTFTFSSALPGVPKLTYGIKGYMGNDYFGIEEFQIRRVSLSAASFSVAVQIRGTTNINMLSVPYLAVDPNFPHHLNTFDNVPINYSGPALTNLSTASTTQLLTYRNVVDYSVQAAALTNNRFSTPLTNNRVILYLSALKIGGTNEGSSLPWYPIDLNIWAEVLSTTTYMMSATLSNRTYISYIYFGQVFVDIDDVQSSNKYIIVAENIDYPNAGGFYPLPAEFIDNFIMGLIDFATPRCQSVLAFNWEFRTVNGVHGVQVNYSLPYDPVVLGPSALDRQGINIFYIKTWQCPAGYAYFNQSSNLCQDICGDYHYEELTAYTCQPCSFNCMDCTTAFDCVACNEDRDFRQLKNSKACVCIKGYYQVSNTTVCQSCATLIPRCIDCFYNSSFRANQSALGARESGCFQCQAGYYLSNHACITYTSCTAGQGANEQTNTCEVCSTGCATCSTSRRCLTCQAGSNYFLDPILNVCLLCSLRGCLTCSSLAACSGCKPGFTLSNHACRCPNGTYYHAEACLLCSPYCLTCTGPSTYECTSCSIDHHRVLVGSECQCDSFNYQQAQGPTCEQRSNNTCERGYVLVQTTGQCVEICGDGWRIENECDDANIINTDGCTDGCRLEPGFVCDNSTSYQSICKLISEVAFRTYDVTKDLDSNLLYFDIDIQPDSIVYSNYDLPSVLHFRGGVLDIQTAYYKDGHLYIAAGYSRNLEGRDVQIQVRQQSSYNTMLSDASDSVFNTAKVTFSLSNAPIPLQTSNNLEVNSYTTEEYQYANNTEKVALAVTIITLIAAFASLVAKNSLSVLININAIQVCYLSLVCIRGMHPITSALLVIRPVLGYNNHELFDLSNYLGSPMVKSVGFVQSFANNFNVMFMVQVALLAASGLMYLAANKKPMIKLASNFLQREAMLMIIFNMTTVFFSLTLMSEADVLNIAFAITSCVVVLYQIVHLVTSGSSYFGFKQIFDLTDKGHYKKFIVCYFLARLGTCLSLSYISAEPLKGLIAAAAFQTAFILLIAFCRPFYHSLNNIFMIAGELVTIAFLAMVYASEALEIVDRMTSTKGMVFAFVVLPCLAVGNLVYSIVMDVKEAGKKIKAFNQMIQAKNGTVQQQQ